MRSHLRPALAVLALGTGLLGCVSLKRTPEARFFALRPLAEAPPTPEGSAAPSTEGATPGAARYVLVGVLPVLLPGHLERPQLVTWAGPGELRVDEFLRWAEPLAESVPRIVADNLGLLLPSGRVIRSPWSSRTPLRCRVRIDISRFGPEGGGEVVLKARWALLPAHSEHPYVTRSSDLHRRAGSGPAPDPSTGVEAMSGLLADLSREIASAVAALPPDEPKG